MNSTKADPLPHWDLTNVYPSLESMEYTRAIETLDRLTSDLQAHLASSGMGEGESQAMQPGAFQAAIHGYLERMNALTRLYSTLGAYTWSFVATDSFNTSARRLASELDKRQAPLQDASTVFTSWLGKNASFLAQALLQENLASQHAFFLAEQVEQSRYLMSNREESLATELSLSGVNAWSRLQGTVASQLSVTFDRGSGPEKLAITALQNLSRDPDAEIRKRAFETEIKAWESVREPMAAALNGVKGVSITLNKRRGRTDPLHGTLDQARIDRQTLQAMLGAIQDSFPVFRRFLRAKAGRLGHAAGLPWYDLSASTAGQQRAFTWLETRDFVLSQFAGFSPRLANLAQRAFDGNWLDAEPRSGKRGGAFCMSLDEVDESRILCNFDGSLDQVFTVAHELGHAFHNECQVGKTPLQTITPMTLAETASIFCETIITEAALARANTPEEQLAILEPALDGHTQVIVDIYSRYLFESEVYARREKSELSADDFCEIMLRAQDSTYGDGLDPQVRNPYMWAWKPHYYRVDLNFYNFPYSFGLLFGAGLYAVYQERGAGFVPDYENLLASTGEADAASLAMRFGIDLRRPEFWQASLQRIGGWIDRYIALSNR